MVDNSKEMTTPRAGKWTPEEEAYTNRLIADFSAGILTDVENGTTMRSWLSAKLRCCPMRISKKFVGEHSIGKRMFERNDARIVEMTTDEKEKRSMELEKLYVDFCESWAREEREREELRASGTRKRKRNRSKKGIIGTKKQTLPPTKTPLLQSSHTTLNQSKQIKNTLQVKPATKVNPPTLSSTPIPARRRSHGVLDFTDLDFISKDLNDFLDDVVDASWMLPLDDDALDVLPLLHPTMHLKVMNDKDCSSDHSLQSPTTVMDLEAMWPMVCQPLDGVDDVLYDPFFEASRC